MKAGREPELEADQKNSVHVIPSQDGAALF
jgi:hypothetical protein